MARIKKPVLFSKYYNISSQTLRDKGVFNPILNLDTRLFIDPILLKNSSHKTIIEDGVAEYNKYFEGIISLLSKSKATKDFAWDNALKQLPEKEIDGTCLGYGTNSISGRGINIELRQSLINTAKEIVSLGIEDPELFSILPLFNKGIGPDTISDITTRAIHKSLLKFTKEKAEELSIPTVVIEIYGEEWHVIQNPLKPKSHILLLPNDILRNLPTVEKWEDIDKAARFNSNLRNRVNKLLAEIFKMRTKREKEAKIAEILKNKQAISDLIDVVKSCKADAYNQIKDSEGLVIWDRAVGIIDNIEYEKETFNSTPTDLNKLVAKIIERFKFLIEQKGLNKLIWKEGTNKRCNEKVAQLIFYATAICYCEANNVDINPEMDTGTGLVDFKFSKGYSNKIIVEIKYSDNSNLINGYKKQLEQYMKSEETDNGIYVVLDVGRMGKKDQELQKIWNNATRKNEIFYIDANLKASASKRR